VLLLEMANKYVPVDMLEPVSVLMGNPRVNWVWIWL